MVGKFITFEGIDGCGKTSVAEAIYDQLKTEGKDILLTQEPTKSWLGDAVKRSISEDHPALTEAFLFMADRATHSKEISSWLEDGKIVLCDRYADSTICYQAASLELEGFEGDPFEWLKEISDLWTLRPDATFVLDIEPETALDRIQSRDKMTKFERLDFLRIVRENFLRIGLMEDRIEVVDATPPLKAVAEQTRMIIESILS
jgi:dTMP kinase